MLMLLGLLSIVVGIGSLVCWIIVLTKLFPAEGALKGILAIICGLYALIWAWQHKDSQNLDTIVKVWTALIVVGIILNIVVRVMGPSVQS